MNSDDLPKLAENIRAPMVGPAESGTQAMPWSKGRGARHERGQSLVEFTLMGVMLLTLLAGVVDLGRAFFTYLALKDAAAEGAYFGSVFPQCESSTSVAGGRCADPNNIAYRARNSAPSGGLVNWTTVAVTISSPDDTPGRSITVTVAYQYTLITPVIGAIVGGQTMPLTARSVAVIVTDKLP